ncbi:hypothetical protein NQ318_021634 [Aromia moschata]|uniref:ZAD domain-containing protein n=1 Tax=Aromia moschata TaxID=1265417 RepID=A0AAV8X6M3_9CUCU|nr:hypothetical protein NQ318_021634 [Aromia moschata]
MDYLETTNICRLCLETTTSSKKLEDSEKTMLHEILPEVSIGLHADFCICLVCLNYLQESYDFRQFSITDELNAETLVNIKDDTKVDRDEIPTTIRDYSKNVDVKKEETSHECCLCRCNIEEKTFDGFSSHEVRELFTRCFPELHLPPKLIVCESCLPRLQTLSSFINTCLEVNEEIQNYCAVNSISDNDVNLKDVATWKMETEIKEEMICSEDESSRSLKMEPGDVNDDESMGRLEDDACTAVKTNQLDLEDGSSLDFYEQALLLALLYRRRKKRKRQRRFWVDPWGAERLKKGMFYSLYRVLRNDGLKFREHFGMSRESFDELLSVIKADISGKDTVMRRCVPAEEKLALALRKKVILDKNAVQVSGHGMFYDKLHEEFRLGISTISSLIHQVCRAIATIMTFRCIPIPDGECWLQISEQFERILNFPNCLGAIGRSHIAWVKFRSAGSLVLTATCDVNYRLTYVEVDCSDADGLKDSMLHKKILDGSLNIPKPRELGESGIVAPFVFLGNSSFTISTYVMRPYSGRSLSQKRKVFNYRLERARKPIDCTFALLSNKWRIFHRPLDVSQEFAEDIVKSCCVLHNFVLEREGYDFEHTLVIEGLKNIDRYTTQGAEQRTASGMTLRIIF